MERFQPVNPFPLWTCFWRKISRYFFYPFGKPSPRSFPLVYSGYLLNFFVFFSFHFPYSDLFPGQEKLFTAPLVLTSEDWDHGPKTNRDFRLTLIFFCPTERDGRRLDLLLVGSEVYEPVNKT